MLSQIRSVRYTFAMWQHVCERHSVSHSHSYVPPLYYLSPNWCEFALRPYYYCKLMVTYAKNLLAVTDILPTLSPHPSISPPSPSIPLLGLTLSASLLPHSILSLIGLAFLAPSFIPPIPPYDTILLCFSLIWLTFFTLSSFHLSWLTQAKVLPFSWAVEMQRSGPRPRVKCTLNKGKSNKRRRKVYKTFVLPDVLSIVRPVYLYYIEERSVHALY